MNKCVKIKDVFDLQMGKTPARNNAQYWRGNNKWISIADIGKSEKIISDTKENITDLAVSESGIKVVPKGTVIMSFKLSIGKTAITADDMFTNEAIMAFINKGTYDIDTNYLYHYCNGNDWLAGSNKAVKGITLNKATLAEKTIKIPDIEEQKHIAYELDAVDDLVRIKKEELENLEQLIKTRFVEMFGDPVRNEKGWSMIALGDVAEIKIGPFGTLLHKEDYITGGHALVNPSHIIDGKICVDEKLTISDEKYEELSAYHLTVGDIVLGRRGEMGRCAVVYQEGLLCGTGSIIVRPNEKMKPYFLQNIISNPTYKKVIEDKAVGVTMMNLNVPIVSSLAIPKLPIKMQEKFIEFMIAVDEAKQVIKQQLEELEILKKSLMQKYFG